MPFYFPLQSLVLFEVLCFVLPVFKYVLCISQLFFFKFYLFIYLFIYLFYYFF